MSTKKYWHKEPLDDIIVLEPPEILRDAIYLLLDNKIITKDYLINTIALSAEDLQNICILPNDFFEKDISRQKIKLRINTSEIQ